jgi:hypothetical protein
LNALKPERARHGLSLTHLQLRSGIADIGYGRQRTDAVECLVQKFDSFTGEINRLDRPVTLPPGLARLVTMPLPSGSEAIGTIGIVEAC